MPWKLVKKATWDQLLRDNALMFRELSVATADVHRARLEVAEARKLLAASGPSVEQVARECGAV